jgi:hypothetical protein
VQLSENQLDQGRVVRLLAQRLGIAPEAIASAADAVALEDTQAKRRQQLERRKAILAEAASAERVRQGRRIVAECNASKLREAMAKTRQELRRIENDTLDLDADAQLAEFGRSREIGLLEAELAQSACPAIRAFVRELDLEVDRLRLAGPTTSELKHRLTDEVRHISNIESVHARLAAIRQAVCDAEALAFTDLNAAEISERLDGLRTGLPPVTWSTPESQGNWQPLENWVAAGKGPMIYLDRGPRPVRPPNANWKPGRKA